MPQSFQQQLGNAPAASFHVLDPVKAARMKARTMFLPAPGDVAAAIAAIPAGQTRTVTELRQALASVGNAETACPAMTVKYWKWLAHASEEGAAPGLPWWRVLKDGRPSRHLPGGVERQTALLRAEGVQV